MAYSYTINQSDHLIHIIIDKITDIDEITDCIKEMVFNDMFTPDYPILIEIKAHYIPTVEELRQLADLIIKLETQFKNKVAISISERLLFSMVKLTVKQIAKFLPIEIEAFDNQKAAMDWLFNK